MAKPAVDRYLEASEATRSKRAISSGPDVAVEYLRGELGGAAESREECVDVPKDSELPINNTRKTSSGRALTSPQRSLDVQTIHSITP